MVVEVAASAVDSGCSIPEDMLTDKTLSIAKDIAKGVVEAVMVALPENNSKKGSLTDKMLHTGMGRMQLWAAVVEEVVAPSSSPPGKQVRKRCRSTRDN